MKIDTGIYLSEETDPCTFVHEGAAELSYPALLEEPEEGTSLREHIFRKGSLLASLLGPTIRKREAHMAELAQEWVHRDLELRPGEWVEVRPYREIVATLDPNGSLKGLAFMPEMRQFCGLRLRVIKRVHRIVMESTGELRVLKHPAVLLEGAACDGSAHHGCDRSCPCFWREQWLKRTDGPPSSLLLPR